MQFEHCLLVCRRRYYKARRLIMLMYLSYHYSAYLLKTPKRVSLLTGTMWVDEMLSGNENAFVENFRMDRETFGALLYDLVHRGQLKRTRWVTHVEQLCLFLYFCGQKASNCNLQQRFQHSGETISRHLKYIVQAFRRLVPFYIQLPHDDDPTSTTIATNTKFFPFFENCRMAIDGTHIPVCVSAENAAPYHGRKGITMNVLAACNFDLVFTFILAGWEGTAGDGRVYADAIQKDLSLSPTKYDLADAGFALTMKCLTPYRGTRYHLKEWASGKLKPRSKEELFNLRLPNCEIVSKGSLAS
ncbi:hypothetical protein Ae201684P_019105 [Aphanomyces euteiches]|nr:hypothetical protein Ae201684P_019105 [Aphanomyces euteiches]KAH9140864.1 hypothetical protein AeRB84_014942 [Aphanomyces euteiches]